MNRDPVACLPNPAEIEAVKAAGGTLCLRFCLYRKEGEQADPTPENTHPTAWTVPMDVRAANCLVRDLGYVRDQEQFRGHTNWTHPTDRRTMQVLQYRGQVIVSWYGYVFS